MDESELLELLVRMRLDLSVFGKCERLLVSRVTFNAMHELFQKQLAFGDVVDPDFTSNLVFRGVPVVHSMDVRELEYAFVLKRSPR